MKTNILALLLALVFGFLQPLRADMLYLKNKRSLEGLVKSEDENSIELEVCYGGTDRKSTRLNSSHSQISYAVFSFKKKKKYHGATPGARRPRCSLSLGQLRPLC